MNYDERIKQCTVDIQAMTKCLGDMYRKVELIREQKAAKVVQWEHGDTANSGGQSFAGAARLFIQFEGTLHILGMFYGSYFYLGNLTAQEWAKEFHYVKTGNIFTNKKNKHCGGS